MYVGHAAIAFGLKSRAPRVPVALLTVAAFGPDWTELVLGLFLGRQAGELYSHCLIGLAIGAAAAWILCAIIIGRAGAAIVALAWLLHWPADYITAYKPLIDLHHLVGLHLYAVPIADAVVEGTLLLACCFVYARAYARTGRQRAWVAAAAIALLALQGMLDFGLASAGEPHWEPRYTRAMWRPRPPIVLSTGRVSPSRMALATAAGNPSASEQWQRTVRAVS